MTVGIGLDLSVSSIPGVGVRTSAELSSLDIFTALDLLMLKPHSVEYRNRIVSFSEISDFGTVNTFVKVVKKSMLPSNVLKVLVEDVVDDCDVKKLRLGIIWCFGRNYLNGYLRVGEVYYLYGKATRKFEFDNSLQMSSFDIKPAYQSDTFFTAQNYGAIRNVYVSDASLNSRISNAIRQVIDLLDWDNLDFGLSDGLMDRFGLPSLKDSFEFYHFPADAAMLESGRRTLSLIECLSVRDGRFKSDCALQRVSRFSKEESDFIASLPYGFTKTQERAIFDIFSDLENAHTVFRLLQGEVGSGKTICVLVSCYHQFLKGLQSALLAPTEILAYQHYLTAKRLFSGFGVRIGFIASKTKKADRNEVLKGLKKGEIDLVIGTHSVLSLDVNFKNLSFVAIDEEQRFGVEQKRMVLSKGENVKVVFMSATPIPRSILKVLSQGYELSSLDGFRASGLVRTLLVSQSRRLEAYSSIRSEFDKGNCAYFVVPRIDDEDTEFKSVKALEKTLSKVFPGVSYAVMTSKTKDKDRKSDIERFLNGEISYIISTSVVEVGMDNPNATCIVIEDADVFGLSALHQLRGRVGRSNKPSWCFLVFRDNITDGGKERLRAIKDENDGFKIAEMDLNMRGGGDIMGLRQSGKSAFKFFDFDKDQDFLDL